MTSTPLFQPLEMGSQVEAGYVGPSLAAGPLPALFYFSLSAKDSLCLDPFNQPVVYLSSLPLRIFSLTLPGHENGLPPTEALRFWAEELNSQNTLLENFVKNVKRMVEMLEDAGLLLPDRTAVAGLSRGAFLATHAAARIPQFRCILGFAPLVDLACAKEFHNFANRDLIESFSLDHLADCLTDRKVRFYIGNLDTRVGTRRCFDFIETLSLVAQACKVRSPEIELIIGPSIGREGHGTSPAVFHEGAGWIAHQLGAVDAL